MSRTIFKYEIPGTGLVNVEMPQRAEVLSVGYQCETLYAWAYVDPSAPMVTRKFFVLGTGAGSVPDGSWGFRGRCQKSMLCQGALVAPSSNQFYVVHVWVEE